MQYNGAANGSTIGSAATVIVTEGPQNKKIRTGVQQPGEMDPHMHIRVSKAKQTYTNTAWYSYICFIIVTMLR